MRSQEEEIREISKQMEHSGWIEGEEYLGHKFENKIVDSIPEEMDSKLKKTSAQTKAKKEKNSRRLEN